MIFTICTESYRDAFDFAIDSWTRRDAKKILVYSDSKWSHIDRRVEIKNVFEKSENWGENICRKAKSGIMSLDEDFENIVFVDMDCFLRADIGHVFDLDFDLAVTRLDREDNASTGVMFLKNNGRVKDFFQSWQDEINSITKFSERHDGIIDDQKTFSKVVELKMNDMKILNLDFRKYNRKISDTKRSDKQKEDLLNDNSIILHFYNKSFLNKNNVKEVIGLLGENVVT